LRMSQILVNLPSITWKRTTNFSIRRDEVKKQTD
jgi:hypothetical protein